MSYIDQENGSRRVAIGGVVLLHIVVGYALISGFAINVITHISPPIVVGEYPEEKTPPPQPKQPTAKPRTTPDDTPVLKEPIFVNSGNGFTLPNDPIYPVFNDKEVSPPPPKEVIVSHARAAMPGSSRAGWVTNDDYPTGALRDEVQGVVGIEVTISAEGKVTACSVNASSGNELLDQATCRLYARRARFQPALDDGGKPTVGHYNDRIRWQIPQ